LIYIRASDQLFDRGAVHLVLERREIADVRHQAYENPPGYVKGNTSLPLLGAKYPMEVVSNRIKAAANSNERIHQPARAETATLMPLVTV
jgi:hypothetical protein